MDATTTKPAKAAAKKNRLNAELKRLIEGKKVGGKKLTQKQFAERAGVSQTTIGNIIRGDRTWVSAHTVKAIALTCKLTHEQAGRLLMLAEAPE